MNTLTTTDNTTEGQNIELLSSPGYSTAVNLGLPGEYYGNADNIRGNRQSKVKENSPKNEGKIDSFTKFLNYKIEKDIAAGATVLQMNLFSLRNEIGGKNQFSIDEIVKKTVRVFMKIKKNHPEKDLTLLPSFGPAGDCYNPSTAPYGNNIKKYTDFHKKQLEPYVKIMGRGAKVLGETFNHKADAQGFIQAAASLGLKPTISFAIDNDGYLVRSSSSQELKSYASTITDIDSWFNSQFPIKRINSLRKETKRDKKLGSSLEFGINCSTFFGIYKTISGLPKQQRRLVTTFYGNASPNHQIAAENGKYGVEASSSEKAKITNATIKLVQDSLENGKTITAGYCCGNDQKDIAELKKVIKNGDTNFNEKAWKATEDLYNNHLGSHGKGCACGTC